MDGNKVNNRKKTFEIVRKNRNKIYWTKEEDELLLKLLEKESLKNKEINWKDIALHFKKNNKQCYYRSRQINPKYNKGLWTKEEDIQLLKLVKIINTMNTNKII